MHNSPRKERILTGIRSNDVPHIGNYLGAFLPMVELQKKYAASHFINMFVPDLHSFTTPIDHGKLYQNSINNLRFYSAAGLDIANENTFIYRQSYIPAHSELTWILDCFTSFGEASRMTQFKDKSTQLGSAHDDTNDPKISVGLFNYPILMAADILLYDAQWVPVGDDQRQHVELCRDLALRLNHKFADIFPGGVFVVPHEAKKQNEFRGLDAGIRIRSLRNPEKKMSKSVSDPAGTILLSDTPDDAAKKILAATTDSEGTIHFNWERQPGVTNLLQILSLLSGRKQHEVNAAWEGKQSYGDLKKEVASAVGHFLRDFQNRYERTGEATILQKLTTSERAMNELANQTLLRAQQAVGLRPRPNDNG